MQGASNDAPASSSLLPSPGALSPPDDPRPSQSSSRSHVRLLGLTELNSGGREPIAEYVVQNSLPRDIVKPVAYQAQSSIRSRHSRPFPRHMDIYKPRYQRLVESHKKGTTVEAYARQEFEGPGWTKR